MASKNKLTKKEMSALENLLDQVVQTEIMLESSKVTAHELFMVSKEDSELERVTHVAMESVTRMVEDLGKSKRLIEDLLNTAQANGGKTK